MQKRIVGAAAALALALALAGCGDATQADAGHAHDGQGNTPVVEGAREIEVRTDGLRFEPAELTVRAGEDVAIVLTSTGGVHDFVVEGAETHVMAAGGQTVKGGLRIDEPGTYTFYCSVGNHRAAGMEGTLTVEEA